ncbi:MAG: hypothetical protein WEA09_12430 [Gemmatimonadota bacterium]
MSDNVYDSLKALQEVDEEVLRIRQRIQEAEEEMLVAEEPALALEAELKAARERLERVRAEERGLERSVEEKSHRLTKVGERLKQVRNVREESAATLERDMLKRSLEAVEQEAMSLLDGIRKAELQVDDLGTRTQEERDAVKPRTAELEAEIKAAKAALAKLQTRRNERLEGLGDVQRRVYESFHAGKRTVVVAHLTHDGACGNCFGMVPLQRQSEIRQGESLVRCEACGVILAPPEEVTAPPGDDEA